MIEKLLQDRKLPSLLKMEDGRTVTRELWPERRKEILRLLAENEYGFTPEAPAEVQAEVLQSARAYAGKGTEERIRLTFETGRGPFSLEFTMVLPNVGQPVPLALHINFRDLCPDRYLPTEEILDSGFGVAQVWHKGIVNDNYHGDYSDGLGVLFFPDGKRELTEWGKIGMWAYAASRILDYLLTRPEIDPRYISVIGHSRLGKTALWCGAQDERFFAALSNDSGCGGAAILRDKTGEHVADFCRSGLWDWFCEKYKTFKDDEQSMPLDQHFLGALMAPRPMSVASAIEDDWADPNSEYLMCKAASEVYELLGVKGFVAPDRLPEVGDVFHEGTIGYHLRSGSHYFSRYDWNVHLAFLKKKMAEC